MDIFNLLWEQTTRDTVTFPKYFKEEATMPSKPTKTEVSQSVELSFTVPGDDQRRTLDIISRIREVLDDVKIRELSMERHVDRVYE